MSKSFMMTLLKVLCFLLFCLTQAQATWTVPSPPVGLQASTYYASITQTAGPEPAYAYLGYAASVSGGGSFSGNTASQPTYYNSGTIFTFPMPDWVVGGQTVTLNIILYTWKSDSGTWEVDESWTDDITWIGSPIIQVSGVSKSINPDGSTLFQFNVENTGNALSGNFEVNMFIDNTLIGPVCGYSEFPPAAPVESREQSWFMDEGLHTVRFSSPHTSASISDTWTSDVQVYNVSQIYEYEDEYGEKQHAVNFSVKNVGNGISKDFNIKFTDGNPTHASLIYSDSVYLFPGEKWENIRLELGGYYRAGTWTAGFEAMKPDGSETLNDGYTANNYGGNTTTLTGDVQVYNVSQIFEYEDEYGEKQHAVRFSMKNTGNGISQDFNIKFSDGNPAYDSLVYDNPVYLLPGEEWTDITLRFGGYLMSGVWTTSFEAVKPDGSATLNDGNTVNNRGENTTTLTSDVQIYEVGDLVRGTSGRYTTSFKIRNIGTGVSPQFNISMVVDGQVVVAELFGQDVHMLPNEDVPLVLNDFFPAQYFSPGTHVIEYSTGNSALSRAYDFSIPVPQNLSVVPAASGIATVSWTPVSSPHWPITRYDLYYGLADNAWIGYVSLDPVQSSGIDLPFNPDTYYFRIQSIVVHEGVSYGSDYSALANATVMPPPVPSKPVGLVIEDLGTGDSLGLTWNASSSPQGIGWYTIERRTGTDDRWSYIATVFDPSTTYVDLDARRGVVNSYRVAATDGSGNYMSEYSDVASEYPDDLLAPNPPSDLSAYAHPTTVNLYWSLATHNEDGSPIRDVVGYYIDRRDETAGEEWSRIGDIAGSFKTDYTSLLQGHEVSYRVQSHDYSGNEHDIAEAPVVTVLIPLQNRPPSAPQNLVALESSILGDIALNLSWDRSPESDVSSYKVYRKTGATGSFALIQEGIGDPQYTDRDVQIGVLYTYYVTAVDQGGLESPSSNQDSNTPKLSLLRIIGPTQAAPATFEPVTGERVEIKWQISKRYRIDYPIGVVVLSILNSSTKELVYQSCEFVPLSDEQGTRTMIWNGRNSRSGNGQIVPGGKYTCQLELHASPMDPSVAQVAEPENIIIPIHTVDIAMDGNRDESIDFDVPEDAKYLFWVNDDYDVLHWSDYEDMWQEDDDPSPDVDASYPIVVDGPSVPRNCDDNYIGERAYSTSLIVPHNCRRDLEDFTRLHIRVDDDTVNMPGITYWLKIENGVDNPSVNIFKAVSESSAYLSQVDMADDQIEETRLLTVDATERQLLSQYIKKGNERSCFILEGKHEGTGDLTFIVKKDDKEICRKSVFLELHDMPWFYDVYSVGVTSGERWDVQIPASASHSQVASYSPPTAERFLLVHGWNVTDSEKTRLAETTFKRLWWQGYQGSVALFNWPTLADMGFWDILSGARHFDNSEFRSWLSADSLVSVFNTLNSSGKLRVMAHSMGNVVTGEAIHRYTGGTLHTYLACQAALSGHYYDNTLAADLLSSPDTPNIMGHFANGTDDLPYLAANSSKVTKRVNYFNEDDWALRKWEINNSLKPDNVIPYYFWYYGSIAQYEEGIDRFVRGMDNAIWSEYSVNNDRELWVILSYIAESRSKALGQTAVNIDQFGARDLKSEMLYDDEHYSHSKEFRSSIPEQWDFWKQVVPDCDFVPTYQQN